MAIDDVTDNGATSLGDDLDTARVRRIGVDRQALESFYVTYYADVVSYFARRLQDPHDVADLVADTFLAAMHSAARYDEDRGRPLAWLLGIGHNTLRRFHRQREADRHAVARFAGRRLLDAEDIATLEEHISTERRARLAYQQLDALSPKDRELVHLVDVVGLTPAEAASAMGLKPGMARVRLFRARAKLRTAVRLSEEPQ
jgi:RNA polymerase sigma-70 factor (ECF subfamily)